MGPYFPWALSCVNHLASPLDCKKIKPVNCKGNQSWIFIGSTDAEAETPILWPPDGRTGSFEKTLMLGKTEAGREGDNRGWDGWIASPTQWTWVWVKSGSWWWTGRPGVLQSSLSDSKRVRPSNSTELILISNLVTDWNTDSCWKMVFSTEYSDASIW